MTNKMKFDHWTLNLDNSNLAWLCFDKHESSANVLSSPVLKEFAAIIEHLELNLPSGLIIYSGKKNGFIMGADIKEFTKINEEKKAYALIRQGQKVLDALEDLACPTLSVINGYTLGGGLELAMACNYRIAIKSDRPIIGLPEVQLGLHPGFGGTVRAVKIAGVRAAMKLMLTGKPIRVNVAHKNGLIDRLCTDEEWQNQARSMIKAKPKQATAPVVEKILNLFFLRGFIAKTLIKQVSSKANKNHYPAPYAMINLWKQHGASSVTGYRAEARSMSKLICGSTSRNLIRVFFLQNKLKSQFTASEININNIHVIGAGIMGGDIASWCALKGFNVTLQDRSSEDIAPALKRAEKLFTKKIRNKSDLDKTRMRLSEDLDGSGIPKADLIIEAIYENLEAKKELYKKLELNMKPTAILATNTSSILLEDLRADLMQPKKFIGLHFFNPVSQLPLVEIISCSDTDTNTLQRGFNFVKKISKSPLLCKSSEGFIVNRILSPYMAEAMHLSEDGMASIDIDKIAVNFGMPMGPVELADTVGIDVALNVSKVLGKAFNRPIPKRLIDMVKNNELGKKSGVGFYTWTVDGATKPKATPSETAKIPHNAEDRLILPMLNEAIACLEEGIVNDSDMLDIGVIFGTGFAPFRGGPIQYAKERGLEEILSAFKELEAEHGSRFKAHPGWQNLK
jgi:3-hydroxyacyl-CoA dehydrogenase/enoyl-CoA hydratase/3-hydroxybutyryl-CoA epimerase